jgi:hypothetical protein
MIKARKRNSQGCTAESERGGGEREEFNNNNNNSYCYKKAI